ncbi:flavin-containing monooxygenase [Nocardia vinacea]|uniref:flavin-containing monooxygenase n=1 Tax=Nocardia vinacea TaxID=96468 RepID=UPI0002F69C19|nr:NAD(P)/FAD-dependent oxidoreductase [Nocardia vinacea]
MSNNHRHRPSIAIVGSGFSGIGLAIRLIQAGFTDMTVYEKAADIGGVWRDNSYPGAACDAPSHLYSYSFEPNPDWSRRFAEQPEILRYLRHCATKYDVLRHIRTNTEVVGADYDAAEHAWTLTMQDGTVARADVLVTACGQLSRPSIPDVPGLDTFTGTVFHSATWNHEHDLRDRDVAVIGNGASAIQFVPHIAAQARSLTVFQRQAHWISPKPDYVYPRLRKRANRLFPILQKLPRLAIFLWFETVLNPMLVSPIGRKVLSWPIRMWCRWNLRRVHDPQARRALVPSYELGCNRILTSNDYYDTLNRENTTLATCQIDRIETDALITDDGHKYLADTIVFATGFRSHDFVAPMRITGSDGRNLTHAWHERPRAHLGLTVPGFPNFFLMYGPNTNVGSGSIVHMLESQMNYIVDAARHVARHGTLEVHPDVLEESDNRTQRRLATTVWNTGGCHSWYVAATVNGPANTNNWPGSMREYRRRTRDVDLRDYRPS